MKTIVEFLRNMGTDRIRYLSSVARIVRARQWNWSVADADITITDAKKFVEYWKPDACIVNNDRLPVELFGSIPTVYTHRDPKTLPKGSILVSYDEYAVADLAARELLSLHLDHYAFVPDERFSYWSLSRQENFLKIMGINFKGVSVFSPPKSERAFTLALMKWLGDLPTPIGVFAANDAVANKIVNACDLAHLRVPEDVVIVGVDNDENICENSVPTLSSVALGEGDIHRVVADMIDYALSRRRRKGPSIVKLVKPVNVIRRASSTRMAGEDADVLAAMELIRLKACEGMRAAEVARQINGSRRNAQRRFLEITGKTIQQALVEIRLARARELLKDGSLSRNAIANRCGYASWVPLYLMLRADERRRHD